MSTIDHSTNHPPAFSGWEAYCAAARALSREPRPTPVAQPSSTAGSADARGR